MAMLRKYLIGVRSFILDTGQNHGNSLICFSADVRQGNIASTVLCIYNFVYFIFFVFYYQDFFIAGQDSG